MIYFENIKTIEEAKKTYRSLAKENHPDKGGDAEKMKVINNEYDFICAKILKGENLSDADFSSNWESSQLFKEKINAIINLEGIEIEIVGLWLWITGNTYLVKDAIKTAGFFFAKKKQAWFWRPEHAAGGRGKSTLDELRSKYGSEKITSGHKYAPQQIS